MFVCAGAARQCSKASHTAVSGLHEALFCTFTVNVSVLDSRFNLSKLLGGPTAYISHSLLVFNEISSEISIDGTSK